MSEKLSFNPNGDYLFQETGPEVVRLSTGRIVGTEVIIPHWLTIIINLFKV